MAAPGPAPFEYDPVTAPKGYCRHKVSTVQIVVDWDLDFFLGNVLKYIERHDVKGGLEDLRKARQYLSMKIELEETGTLKETIRNG